MAKDILDTIKNYDYQLRYGASTLRPGSDISTQVSRYANGAVRDSILVTQTKQILNSAGVSTLQYLFYYAFVRKLNKRLNGPDGPKLSGESASIEAANHVAQWVMRGLSQSVLSSIVVNVLNISYPPQL
jgi:predicted alpha/beta-hydrolase family hydrolase